MNRIYSILMNLAIGLTLLSTIGLSQSWTEDWEGNWSADWHITFGTWEVGIPTSGPGSAYNGQQCAATVLDGNYGSYVDSTRLVRHTSFVVPPASENPRLRFWHWYHFIVNDDDYGKVQIKVDGNQNWEDLPDGFYQDFSGAIWTRPSIDLSAYAGLSVQICFYFHSDNAAVYDGWYIDDITIETGAFVFNNPEDWESGYDDWYVDYGTWEVGEPTSGPGSAHQGSNCAATILAGNYSNYIDSTRLISPPFTVPPTSENPRLRFWHWYHFIVNDNDYGKVQIKVDGNQNWEDLPDGFYQDFSGAIWTRPSIDLSAYAGLSVQICFYFHSDNAAVYDGWYIDDITIETGAFVFNNPEDWESGYDDWYVDYGTWEVGEPTSGPGSAHQGSNCAATILAGNYTNYIDSTRLISPPFTIPSESENPALRFWHWYHFKVNDNDYGEVQIKLADSDGGWITLEQYLDASSIWFEAYIPLSDYADSTVQISFYFHSDNADVQAGWYIDEINILPYIVSNADVLDDNVPLQFQLSQNYPNPFNPSTKIKYQLQDAGFVALKVYDVLGNEVATLVNEEKPSGSYEVNFSASNLSSGIYFYKLQAGNFVETRKMVLMK